MITLTSSPFKKKIQNFLILSLSKQCNFPKLQFLPQILEHIYEQNRKSQLSSSSKTFSKSHQRFFLILQAHVPYFEDNSVGIRAGEEVLHLIRSDVSRRLSIQIHRKGMDRRRKSRTSNASPIFHSPRFSGNWSHVDETRHLFSKSQIDQQQSRSEWPHYFDLHAQICRPSPRNSMQRFGGAPIFALQHLCFSGNRIFGRDRLSK